MASEYSTDDYFEWLKGQRRKGVLNDASYASYKTAAKKMFSILTSAEGADLRKVDPDGLLERFKSAHGSEYQTITMQSYDGRVRAGLSGFLSPESSPSEPETNEPRPIRPASISVPIPIRADLTVYVHGMPFDLTASEAKRISNVVLAMASS